MLFDIVDRFSLYLKLWLTTKILLILIVFTAVGAALVHTYGFYWEILLYNIVGSGISIYLVVSRFLLRSAKKIGRGHYHKDEAGALVRCYHKAKNLMSESSFWIGLTLGFPIEHFLWTKVWPFYRLSHFMGLE